MAGMTLRAPRIAARQDTGIRSAPIGAPPSMPSSPVNLPGRTPIQLTRPSTFETPQTGIKPQAAIATQQDPNIRRLIDALNESERASTTDPRLGDAARELEALRQQAAANNVDPTQQESEELTRLSSALMRGEGVNVGDVSGSAAASAYRLARQRAGERERAAAAAAAGASGGTGVNLDTTMRGLREAEAEDVAKFEGGLSERLRQQKLAEALGGADIRLQDLNRRRSVASEKTQTQFDALNRLIAALQAQEGDRASLRGGQRELLNTLLSEQGRVQATADENAYRTAEERRNDERYQLERLDRRRGNRGGGFATGGAF